MDNIGSALSKFTQISINMIVPIIVCLFIGKWIDEKLGTNAIFTIIFVILGVLSAFRNLYVYAVKPYQKEQIKEDKKREKFKP